MGKNRLRGSGAWKILAFLLSSVLICCLIAGVAGCYYLFNQHSYYANNQWEYYGLSVQLEQAQEYFILDHYQAYLTAAGKTRYEELTENLSDKNTNFRFEVGRTSDAALLLTNLSNQSGTYEITNTVDSSLYTNAMSRMLAYYIDVERAPDWEVRTGTARQWAATPNASRYYYDPDTYQNILLDAQKGEAAGDENPPAVVDVTDEESIQNMGEALAAYDEEVDTGTQDTGNPYVYFVFTGEDINYWLSYGIDRTYPVEDEYSQNATQGKAAEARYQRQIIPQILCTCGAALLLAALMSLYTLSLGWDRNGVLELRGGSRMPIELAALLTAICVFVSGVMESVFYFDMLHDDLIHLMISVGSFALPAALGGMLFWTVGAAQLKTHTLAQRSLAARLWRWLCKWGRVLWEKLSAALLSVPLYWKAAVFCGVFWLLYLIYYLITSMLFGYHHLLVTVFFLTLPMIPLAVLVCKWAMDWNRLRTAVKEMVGGKLDYQVDTSNMLPDLRAHGEDLNSLSKGLSLALEERIRGERFKTELITNVSHDLKTPLTSIINYVDLLKQADIQDETARGYIEVLERKSQRLKTLTEDLVEASKAATGNIAVHLDRLDMGQLVSQAVAEYDERLTNAGLTPVVKLPEQPCTIMGDGRHLWRVLDNLLGNCTKYAMPGTRVYLDVTCQEGRCRIEVKNISADPLNLPPEDLMKRFVRGDSARSTEGSGLGLSIARNLTNAQNGTFDLAVDGDLFKAMLSFPLVEEE